MNGMDDWNARRKARGRIKRAQQRRRRQRATAVAIATLLGITALAMGTVNYGAKQHREREIEATQHVSYSMPRIPLAAVAQAKPPESQLPQMLNIREQFPDYDEAPAPVEEEESSGDEGLEPSDEAPANMVILDDLRAAPPKSMFVRAVFENADTEYVPKEPRKWLWLDGPGDNDFIWGEKGKRKKKEKMPPIPEPGTGVLLGLGLTMLSEARRRQRRRETEQLSIRHRG